MSLFDENKLNQAILEATNKSNSFNDLLICKLDNIAVNLSKIEDELIIHNLINMDINNGYVHIDKLVEAYDDYYKLLDKIYYDVEKKQD